MPSSPRTTFCPLSIETIETMPPPPCPDDASVAAGIQRIMNFVRSRTLEMPPPGQGEQPPFVSATPNEFPRPRRLQPATHAPDPCADTKNHPQGPRNPNPGEPNSFLKAT